MPKKSRKRKATKKAASKKRTSRKKASSRRRPAPRVKLARTKIPGGGAAAQIHQGTGAGPPPESVPQADGDASK